MFVMRCIWLLLLLVLSSGEKYEHKTLSYQEQRSPRDQKIEEKCNIPWFVQGRNGTCHCGNELGGIVQCDSETKEVTVLDCYCLTNHYTVEQGKSHAVGCCIFDIVNISTFFGQFIYHAAPSHCKEMHRKGTLCGRCLDGYALPAYSYDSRCMKCDRELQNWWLYIVYAFLPLTVFIVIILVFRINVASPKLYFFVLASQHIASPLLIRILIIPLQESPGYLKTILYFLVTVYGVWNLNFFRIDVLPAVCINVIPLHTLALDYLVAIYPMMVMGVAYIIVELHGLGFRPVLFFWWPFHRFLARFRRQWGIETSIMDAFVTFFILSTTKLFSVSFVFLASMKLFISDGEYSLHLYYDPSIKYFSKEHLPYALLAIFVLTVFILFPLSLLLCYQFTVFRKCLRKCQLSGPTLDMYVHSFQQYYKDGSNGTRDCRWFAGFFLIVQLSIYVIYTLSLCDMTFVLSIFALIIAAVIVLVVQPYKEEYKVFNIRSANVLLWMALLCATVTFERMTFILPVKYHDYYTSTAIISLFPFFYIMGAIVHHFYKRCCYKSFNKAFVTVAISSLPYRILHSDQY